MERFSIRHGLAAFSAGVLRRSMITGLAIGTVFFATSAASAATLNVVGGQLLGASGVDVGGSLYDVAFVDGTCIDLFSGCASFAFPTQASAQLAAQALLDEVFVNGVAGAFDDNPALTQGCSASTRCTALTPYGLQVAIGAANFGALPDLVQNLSTSPVQDMTGVTRRTWAVWSVATPIPEPGTALLLGLGLIALGSRRSREG